MANARTLVADRNGNYSTRGCEGKSGSGERGALDRPRDEFARESGARNGNDEGCCMLSASHLAPPPPRVEGISQRTRRPYLRGDQQLGD